MRRRPASLKSRRAVIHTFGEYLDFHQHLHAPAADGLFVDSGLFHVMPETSLAPLEELFRARVIAFLVKRGLLPPERARMLRDLRPLRLATSGLPVCEARPASRNAGCLTPIAQSGILGSWKSPLPASISGPTPRRAGKRFPISPLPGVAGESWPSVYLITKPFSPQTSDENQATMQMRPIASILIAGSFSAGFLQGADKEASASSADSSQPFLIGWSRVDITPKLPAALAGMTSLRVAREVLDPLTATVLVLDAPYETDSRPVILVSCDLRSIHDSLRDQVREILAAELPEIDPLRVVINATHTHNAPPLDKYGLPVDALDNDEYNAATAPILAAAIAEAWRNRRPGGISFGLTHAVIGHNRIMAYNSGKSQMGGRTNDENFSHVEGFEDSSVHALYTWNAEGALTGVVINVAVPFQESMSQTYISADAWHDVRVELRSRLGENLYVLPQCAPAGDQMSRVQINRRAEDRMQDLNGRNRRQEIAVRLAGAIESILPVMRKNIDWHPVLLHRVEEVGLPRRMISEADVEEAARASSEPRAIYAAAMAELEENPALLEDRDFVGKAGRAFWDSRRGDRVAERFELQKSDPSFPVEMHVIRLGDTAIATNPFELYLDFGVQIRARSIPVQTFLVQLAGPGSYIPTQRSVRGGAYGAVPASTNVGPEGGKALVDWTVAAINSFWPEDSGDHR